MKNYLKNNAINKFITSPSAVLCILLVAILYLVSCSKNQAEEPKPDNPTPIVVSTENVSYNNYVKGIFEVKCNSCHAKGASASGAWTFSDYTSVRSNASRLENVLLVTRTMPMGSTLSSKERELLDAWFNKRNTAEN